MNAEGFGATWHGSVGETKQMATELRLTALSAPLKKAAARSLADDIHMNCYSTSWGSNTRRALAIIGLFRRTADTKFDFGRKPERGNHGYAGRVQCQTRSIVS